MTLTPLRVACVGLIVFAVTYVATSMFPVPLPTLNAETGAWRIASRSSPVEMRYYGQLLAAGLAAMTVAWPLSRAANAEPSRADLLWIAWAGVAITLCLSYYAWHNWP